MSHNRVVVEMLSREEQRINSLIANATSQLSREDGTSSPSMTILSRRLVGSHKINAAWFSLSREDRDFVSE